MMKLPIRYFTNFNEDTDELEFLKHAPAFDLIHENGYGIRFSENGTHEPFITNIYKDRMDKAIEYIERYLRLNLEAFDTKDLLQKILEILDKESK